MWVAGTQRCPAEETSTIQNDTRSPLRLSVQKRQSCGLFCSVFLFPSFRDLRILFLPSLEVKPGVPLKVTHTHSSTTVCPGAAWKEPPKRFTIPHSPPCLRSAPSQLRINVQKLSGDQDTSRKRMFSGRLRSAGRLSLLGWAFSPSFQTRTRFNPGPKPVVLRLECASGSPGELAGLQIARPCPGSFRFHGAGHGARERVFPRC